MRLFFKTITGRTLTLEIDNYDITVVQVACMLAEELDWTPSDLHLIFAGKKVEYHRLFFDYNMGKESTLHILQRAMLSLSINVTRKITSRSFELDIGKNNLISDLKNSIQDMMGSVERCDLPCSEQSSSSCCWWLDRCLNGLLENLRSALWSCEKIHPGLCKGWMGGRWPDSGNVHKSSEEPRQCQRCFQTFILDISGCTQPLPWPF